MRLVAVTSQLLSLTTLLLSQQAAAALIPELLQHLDIFSGLEKRCVNPCGYYGQLCCASNQVCYTDANGQAACGTGNQGNLGGSWLYATTTYVQTDLKTVTATYSTYVGATTQAPSNQCSYAQGQTQCGSTCCNSGYYCQSSNMCVQIPGGSSGYYGGGIYTVTTVVTNAGAPLRPTTQTILTLTSTGIAGTTAYQTPVGTGGAVLGASTGSSSTLSGGAIAGIVIGVIVGLIILLLFCLCCCAKGLLDGLLGILGLGKKKRVTEETIIEERHSHRNNGFASAWFGRKPARTEVVEEKRTSGFNRALGVTAFLGTTAALLGLKRSSDRRKDDRTGSSYSYSSYSDDYTSDSSPSSVTRTSRRSRSRR